MNKEEHFIMVEHFQEDIVIFSVCISNTKLTKIYMGKLTEA